MRYRDLVILIALVAISSWAYEANDVDSEPTPLKTPQPYFRDSSAKSPPPKPQQSYFRYSQEELQEDIPSAELSVGADSRLRVTLNYPEYEAWEPLGLARVEFDEQSYEVRKLSQIDKKTWDFELSEEALSALNSAAEPLVRVRLNVLDSEYKVSRSMRSFEVETSAVRWASR